MRLYHAGDKVGRMMGMFPAMIYERVRESEHATMDDIITFAETLLDGPYREKEEGKSFRRVFERMLKEGVGVIAEEVEAARKSAEKRRRRAAENVDVGEHIGSPGFKDIFDAFFGGDLPGRDFFGGVFSDDDENTASRKLYSTQSDKGRPKGYATWDLQKKTKVIMAQVEAILEEYEAELPLTARQIFYRLVGKYGYPKTEGAYESLTTWLVRARRSRMIPFESIRDDGASVMKGKFYTGEEDFYGYIQDEAKAYKRDKLATQKRDIRVYVESAGMMPQLTRVAEQYSVPVYSCSGFDSLTAKYDLADDVAKAFNWHGRQTVILHLGDMDPSGETIFDAISEDVYAFLEVDVPHKRPEDVAVFERVALTEALVAEYDLPTDPAKESSHSAGWGGRRACQLEALAPDILARVLRDAIKNHMDLDVLEADREAEIEERRKIAKALPAPGKDSGSPPSAPTPKEG